MWWVLWFLRQLATGCANRLTAPQGAAVQPHSANEDLAGVQPANPERQQLALPRAVPARAGLRSQVRARARHPHQLPAHAPRRDPQHGRSWLVLRSVRGYDLLPKRALPCRLAALSTTVLWLRDISDDDYCRKVVDFFLKSAGYTSLSRSNWRASHI